MSIPILEVINGPDGLVVPGPDAATVARAAQALTLGGDSFLRLDHDEYRYLQVTRTGADAYYVDFRESEDGPNYFTPQLSLATLQSTLEAYRSGEDFKTGIDWQPSNEDGPGMGDELLAACGLSDEELDAFQAGLNGEFETPFVPNEATAPGDIGGYIAHYGLADWWLTTFNGPERRLIEEADHGQRADFDNARFVAWSDAIIGEEPAPSAPDATLTTGTVEEAGVPAGTFLCGLVSLMDSPRGRSTTSRLADKAMSLLHSEQRPLDLHFGYSTLMTAYYRNRENEADALDKAILAAERMIAVASRVVEAFRCDDIQPTHHGYEQLAIIRDKQGDYAEAVRLCREALAAGWSGDWEKRIARYEKKLAR